MSSWFAGKKGEKGDGYGKSYGKGFDKGYGKDGKGKGKGKARRRDHLEHVGDQTRRSRRTSMEHSDNLSSPSCKLKGHTDCS